MCVQVAQLRGAACTQSVLVAAQRQATTTRMVRGTVLAAATACGRRIFDLPGFSSRKLRGGGGGDGGVGDGGVVSVRTA